MYIINAWKTVNVLSPPSLCGLESVCFGSRLPERRWNLTVSAQPQRRMSDGSVHRTWRRASTVCSSSVQQRNCHIHDQTYLSVLITGLYNMRLDPFPLLPAHSGGWKYCVLRKWSITSLKEIFFFKPRQCRDCGIFQLEWQTYVLGPAVQTLPGHHWEIPGLHGGERPSSGWSGQS